MENKKYAVVQTIKRDGLTITKRYTKSEEELNAMKNEVRVYTHTLEGLYYRLNKSRFPLVGTMTRMAMIRNLLNPKPVTGIVAMSKRDYDFLFSPVKKVVPTIGEIFDVADNNKEVPHEWM